MTNKFIRNIIFKLNAQSTCKRATFLIEKKINTRISIREWLEMQAHLAICPLCPVYKKQSRLLQQMMIKIFQKRKDSTIAMDEHKKHALEKLLRDRLNNRNT